MPQIRQYETPQLGLNPSERGVSAVAGAARRVQGAFNEAAEATNAIGRQVSTTIQTVGGEVLKAVEHQELSVLTRDMAALQDNATKKWNDTAKKADPNDVSVGPKFLKEELEPSLEKMANAPFTEKGQQWALAHSASFRQHMQTKVDADMSSMAGHAIAANLETTRNQISSTVRSDPTSVQESMKLWDSAVDNLVATSPNLTGPQAAKVRNELLLHGKQEIAKSSLIGLATRDPNGAIAAIEKGTFAPYLSGADAKAIVANARQQIRAERIDQAYLKTQANDEKRAISDVAENGWLKKLYSDDPKVRGTVSTKAIVNDDDLLNPIKEKLLRFVEREMKPETDAQISRVNTVDLFSRISLPDGNPAKITNLNEIDKAYIDQKISRQDHDWLRKNFIEARTPEGLRLTEARDEIIKAVAPSIDKSNPLMGKVDQDGKLKLYLFRADLDKKIAAYRAEGKNPYDLFDPAKPDFVGKPDVVGLYQKSLQESMNDVARRLRSQAAPGPHGVVPGTTLPASAIPAAPLRKTGESADAYLKRIGAN